MKDTSRIREVVAGYGIGRTVDTVASHRLGLACALLCALALVSAGGARHAFGQQGGTLRADVAGVGDGDYPYARAVINVDDASGADVGHLDPSSFAVTVDGKPVAVTAADLASSQNVPLDVLLVIDVSGSMAGDPLARAKEAARGLVGGLALNDRVAMITFSDDVLTTQDYTTDRAATAAAIDALVASGNTALYRATAASALKIGSTAASRRAVIFLSDGAQDGVAVTIAREQAIEAAGAGGAPFFTVGEGKGIDRDYLQQLAQVTRGRYLEAPDPKDLGALYDGIGRLLRSQYVVTFDASTVAAGGSSIAITVKSPTESATATAAYKPGANFAPSSVTLEGLKAGEKLDEARTITLGGGAGLGARAAFYVDGVNVFETETKPFAYKYEPRSFGAGAHTLKASVNFGTRSVDSDAVSFTSAPPAPAASGGGLPLLPIAAIALVLVIGVPVGIVMMRLRAMHKEGTLAERTVQWEKPAMPSPIPAHAENDDEAVVPEEVGEPLGILISRSGSDIGTEYTVGGSPISIGSGARCAVRVRDEELAAEEARIWIRKGHLMLHKMTKLTTIVNDGTSGGWQILEPGDTFQIDQHTFEFKLLPAAAPAPDPGAIPNVPRDDGGGASAESQPRPMPAGQPSAMPAAHDRLSTFSQLMPKNDWEPNG